ncbi:hypothetical protein, partial [Actinoplanes sp. GCM10030250]|uniref:hypothetical protein n=1 Tax=Actinoplanes sp. GCM10030250 TaxID=3273376 RepID=UPI00360BE068
MKFSSGYLMVWGLLGGLGGAFLLFWTLWFAGGAAGAILFVALLVMPFAVWWLVHELRKSSAIHRAEAEARQRAAWLEQYPADARPLIDRLEHPVQAEMAWASIGLGRLPDPVKYGPSDLGEAPRLVGVRRSPAG